VEEAERIRTRIQVKVGYSQKSSVDRLSGGGNSLPPNDALVDPSTWLIISNPLERLSTVHPTISTASQLFERIQSPPFDDVKWAFRGLSDADYVLRASIEGIATKPGTAEDYLEREFRRRAHHFLTDVPSHLDDLEWLALMQHHNVPTRLVDWTKSACVAAFFAAESANSAKPFAIWAIDQKSVHAEAVAMLGLPEGADLSSRENFAKIYSDPQPDMLLLATPVQPFRMNERLTIQQGLFLCANHPLLSFHRCLAALLVHGSRRHLETDQWLHKFVVAPEARLDVIRMLNKININSATLFPGIDGFCKSLRTMTEVLDKDNWLEVPDFRDRELWVRGGH
jgi:hypothetical protein